MRTCLEPFRDAQEWIKLTRNSSERKYHVFLTLIDVTVDGHCLDAHLACGSYHSACNLATVRLAICLFQKKESERQSRRSDQHSHHQDLVECLTARGRAAGRRKATGEGAREAANRPPIGLQADHAAVFSYSIEVRVRPKSRPRKRLNQKENGKTVFCTTILWRASFMFTLLPHRGIFIRFPSSSRQSMAAGSQPFQHV
jgi:hypothetical protein